MAIIYKGSPSLGLKELPKGTLAAAIVGSAAVVALLSVIFWLPFVHARVVKKDYSKHLTQVSRYLTLITSF
jgi:sodium-dependent phosphate transporter